MQYQVVYSEYQPVSTDLNMRVFRVESQSGLCWRIKPNDIVTMQGKKWHVQDVEFRSSINTWSITMRCYESWNPFFKEVDFAGRETDIDFDTTPEPTLKQSLGRIRRMPPEDEILWTDKTSGISKDGKTVVFLTPMEAPESDEDVPPQIDVIWSIGMVIWERGITYPKQEKVFMDASPQWFKPDVKVKFEEKPEPGKATVKVLVEGERADFDYEE